MNLSVLCTKNDCSVKKRMKKILIVFVCCFVACVSFAQNSIPNLLARMNQKSVPYLTVKELKSSSKYVVLDAREPKEFKVSHLENAVNVGFNKFDGKKTAQMIPDKNTPIVVYCSIGVRSEKIGEKLLKLGYKNVFNLYGGIFEWKNKDGNIVDEAGFSTDSVHTYNKEWSIYLAKGIKVYED